MGPPRPLELQLFVETGPAPSPIAYLLRGRLNIRFRGLKKDVELAAELNWHLDLDFGEPRVETCSDQLGCHLAC